jgi:hypothetical protein
VWVEQITVIFRPSTSIDYVSSAFLDVVGQEKRLALTMRGHGIGSVRINQ